METVYLIARQNNRTAWKTLLERRGYHVHLNGVAGRPAAGPIPSLILMDVENWAPSQSLEAIREMRSAFPDVEILVVAGAELQRCDPITAGARACVRRPIDPAVFCGLVDRMARGTGENSGNGANGM